MLFVYLISEILQMKKIFSIVAMCISSLIINAQTVSVDPHTSHNNTSIAANQTALASTSISAALQPDESLTVKEMHDFGKIPQGKPVTYNFEVTNTGKTSFKLDNVVAGCGCTTPQWDKDKIINAGEKSIITVGFNAAAEGPFIKPVTITYNGAQTKVITIKGEVWKTPTASAPANSSLNDFKN